jgi:hypothetical protein
MQDYGTSIIVNLLHDTSATYWSAPVRYNDVFQRLGRPVRNRYIHTQISGQFWSRIHPLENLLEAFMNPHT